MITEDERRGLFNFISRPLQSEYFARKTEKRSGRVLPSFLLPSAFRNRCVRGGPKDRTNLPKARTAAVLDSFAAVGAEAEAEGGRERVDRTIARDKSKTALKFLTEKRAPLSFSYRQRKLVDEF